jgi:UDP-glucose:(heptosyl)LPS alpha-1,3-glucosyltransferase
MCSRKARARMFDRERAFSNRKSMKIGLVRRGYSATGGAEKYLLRLAMALAQAGHELVLFSDVPWPEQSLNEHHLRLNQAVIKARDPWAFAKGIRSQLRQERCDQVLSLERIFACDVYRAGDGVHASWLQRRARYEPKWKAAFRWLNRKHSRILALERSLFSGGAKRVIANSQLVKRDIVQHFPFPEDRIDVVYNGLPAQPTEPVAREAVRKELQIDAEEYVAIFVGSGWERKGLRFAIEAIRQLGEDAPILLVAGRGEEGWLPKSPRVRFLGPRTDIPRLLAASDVFVLPTIYDPFSNASLEALAAGLPVITTRANGFSEIINRDIEGDLLPRPDDIEALMFSLCAWGDPVRRELIRPRLLAKAAGYSIERNVTETLAVLEKAQGRDASPRQPLPD